MKKLIPFVLVLVLSVSGYFVKAQTIIFTNDLESWNGNVPVGLSGSKTTLVADSIKPYTTSSHSPTHAVQLINSLSGHKRFTTQAVSVTTGTVYTINFWVRGQGNIRTGLYDQRTTGSGYAPYNAYVTVNSESWALVTQTLTCANTTTTAEFILSIQNTVAAGDHLQVDDISISYGGGGNPAISISSPANNATIYGTSATIVYAVSNFVVGNPGTGIDGHIHYYLDGGAVVMVYNTNPIALSGLTSGNHTVILQLVDNNHNPLSPNVADTVNFIVDTNPPNMVSIHEVQYTTDVTGNSPYMDEVVTVGGLVTGRYASGYFLQSGTGAWNGIYIYDNINAPTMGDSVILTGLVSEYYNLTEIKSITAFGVVSSGNTLPEPVIATCQDVNAEQYEGVLVTAYHVVCTNPSAGFGMWKIQDSNGDTAKVHNLLYSYTPVLNTMYNVTGPTYYSFNEFRIEPRSMSDIVVVTGIDDPENSAGVSLYPNPAQQSVTIKGMQPLTKGTITNLFGQYVKYFSIDNQKDVTLDISNLPAGIYFVKVNNNERMIKRFVKE